jgi:hypothetical protein
MKDHPERKGSLQLIESMFAGHSWQTAVAQSQLNVSRATAYRLRQLARDEEKAELAFLDDRHGHPYKLTDKVASLDQRVLHGPSASGFEPDSRGTAKPLRSHRQCESNQPDTGQVRGEPPLARSEPRARGKKLNEPQPVWHEGIGSLLLLAAAQQTGLLETLVEAVMALADPTIPGLNPPNPAVRARLLLTLLFLPVAGLARTWDLRSYTGTMLAVLTGRERAYSQRYAERFLARLAHTGAAECLTEVMAKWTWSLWHAEQACSDPPADPAVFSLDGHRKAVYSDVLVPRGPVGRLGGKILGCRELVVLHDAHGHPLLATTHRGDQHLTIGLPRMLHCYEQATAQVAVLRVVVDREGVAAEFLAQLHLEGRQVITRLAQ